MKDHLRELRVFTVVAETGHFTRAAERLGISQSVLSAAIGRLETALGVRLFDRHTRQCHLSEAGMALLPEAMRLVNDWDRLVRNARDMQGLVRGRITVAAPTAQCALLLPPLIREFTDRHPGVRVDLRDVPEYQVHELVREGVADLGIATDTGTRSDLVGTAFYSDQYIAAMAPDHPLARRGSLEWRQVAACPIIGPLPDSPVRSFLDSRLAELGFRLDYAHEVSLPWTMVGLAEAGLGLAVVTVALRPLTQWRRLVVKPIGRPSITRSLLLLRRPDRSPSPSVIAFRELILGRRQG